MESLSQEKLHFAWITILCVDILKIPLKDILNHYVKPKDLQRKTRGINLSPEQKNACLNATKNNYSDFDITLLYKLIRNLCSQLEITRNWGNEPRRNDKKFGDDIERIRLFRNRNYGHSINAEIPKNEFDNMWTSAESILQRMYTFTTTIGCNSANYPETLTNVRNPNLTIEEYLAIVDSFTVISIKGETTYFGEETAHLRLEVNCKTYEHFSIEWWKINEEKETKINRENEKYIGTTNRELVIHSVSKGDEGRYRANFWPKINVKVTSNTVYLEILEADLPKFYHNQGVNCSFSHLFDDLAVNYPKENIDGLKDQIENSGAVQDVTSLRQAKSARDCLRILRDEKTFTPLHVMVVQYLMKRTECEELEQKCIEYAKEKDVMYFHVNPSVNGFKNIYFHVSKSISTCSPKLVMKVKTTLAAMLECSIDEIHEAGYQDSTSFYLVLSIKETYVKKLLTLKQQEKENLIQLNIDFFEVDDKIIYLGSLKDAKDADDDKSNSTQHEKKHKTPLAADMLFENYISTWRVNDNEFVETHSFPHMLEKVRSQPYVTFVGVPGSGKTATARHIALKLQEEDMYDILPIKCIMNIETYCDPHIPQVFVIDDLLGIFGLDPIALKMLDMYEDIIKHPIMSKTKILMTCRETVFRNKMLSKSFLLKQENTICLHSKENELINQDRYKLLEIYKLKENILTLGNVATTSKMFPFLCKLFSRQDSKAYGSNFFKSPISFLLRELSTMQIRNKIHYGSLVLLMANQNKLSKQMLEDEKHTQAFFHEMKRKLLISCKVSTSTYGFEIIDALTEMEGTYTKKLCRDCDWSCDCEFTFLDNCMLEITAYHFGQQFPELILTFMSSDYVANKIIINQQGQDDTTHEMPNESCVEKENVIDLCIRLSESQYYLVAERLWRDLKKEELSIVLGNEALKHPPVLQAFIELVERKEYTELYSVILSELTKQSEFLSFNFSNLYHYHPSSFVFSCIGKLLKNEISEGMINNVRAISWVVYFGHHKILQNIVDRIIQEKGNVNDLFQTSYNKRYTDSGQIGIVTNVEGATEVVGAVESVTVEQSRLLCLGCASGDLNTVKVLLCHVGPEVINYRFPQHQYDELWETTPITIACYFGYLNIVFELLIAGADVNPNLAIPPLNVACGFGYSEIIKILIQQGANINSIFHQDTPLTFAISRRHLNVIDDLLKAGADVNLGRPLTTACREGRLDIVQKLIKAGSNINPYVSKANSSENDHIVNPRSTTFDLPLTAACHEGHSNVVRELIYNGADVNKEDNFVTPLAAACSKGHLGVIKLLLKSGSNKTVIPYVSYIGHTGEVLKLIRLGIDLSRDELGKKSITAACAQGQLDLAEDIIKEGIDVNLKDGEKIPLIVACYFGNLNVVRKLIIAGADVNIVNGFITPLQVACYEGHLNVVSELIKGGANVNLKYKEGTALAAACFFGHVDVVKELIKAGADVNQKSHYKTPIEIAEENSYYNVCVELITARAYISKKHSKVLHAKLKTTKTYASSYSCL